MSKTNYYKVLNIIGPEGDLKLVRNYKQPNILQSNMKKG